MGDLSRDVLRAETRRLALSVEAGETGGVDFDFSKRQSIFTNLTSRLRGYPLIPDIYVTTITDREKKVTGIIKLSVSSEGNLVQGRANYRLPTEHSPAIIEVYLEAKEISYNQFDGLTTLVNETLHPTQ